MKQKKILVAIAIVLVTLITSCVKDDFQETLGLCPTITSTNPVNSAVSVPLNQVITVTFNEEINPATINSNSFVVTGNTTIGGSITYSGLTATFTPTANLTPNTTYVVKITTAVKDLRGNALQEDYIFTFSTGASLQPIVISTSPTANETGVVLNKVVRATFNMPMDVTTLNTSTFTLKQGTTTISQELLPILETMPFLPQMLIYLLILFTLLLLQLALKTQPIHLYQQTMFGILQLEQL